MISTQAEVFSTTHQTYRQAAKVLGRAFADEPVSAMVYRKYSRQGRIKALTYDFTVEMEVCLRKGCPLQFNEDSKVVAAATVYPPGAWPLPHLDQWQILLKSIIENGFYEVRTWMRWLEEVDRLHPREPHYYLEYLGVEPDRQGKGYGSALLRNLTAKADQEQMGCYLETASPASVPLYQRFNFQTILQKEIIGLPAWLMWRPACTASIGKD
jgi:GNAT superfamily N-acetyltransferase